jgi:hypothetical protein
MCSGRRFEAILTFSFHTWQAGPSAGLSVRESRAWVLAWMGFWSAVFAFADDFCLRGRQTGSSIRRQNTQLAGLLLLLLWLAERGIRVSVLLLIWSMDFTFSFKEGRREIPSRLLSCT